MRNGPRTSAALAGAAIGILTIGVGDAFAGGFAIREESAYGQGSSFAGVAAGGALSSMFWNPATITQQPGINIEAVATGIFPHSTNTPGAGSALLFLGGTGNTGDDAFVPSGYASWQLNPHLWLGLSFNAPFGLSVSFPDLWAGRNNATPSIAVKINEWLSIGAGVQIMYGKADLNTGFLPVPGSHVNLNGDGWAYGFTAGVTVTPTPTTEIGLGWRSALDLGIDGALTTIPVVAPTVVLPASAKLRLPDIVTLGLRQKLAQDWTLLATVEWDNWSRIGTAPVTTPLGVVTTLPFQYQDGWFFSIGAEYAWDARTTLRAGVGYEISPITDHVRTPRLPDNDRIWLSAGLSYKMFEALTLDIGYSHIFVNDTPINITAASGNPWFATAGVPYIGTVDSSVDIVSVGLRYRFNPPPPAPVLVTKG
jgi:long-chain fatty acid transport protein